MKKMFLIAAMAVMSVAAGAQDLKFAFVDFNEVIMLMPEMDQARATLEENQKTNEEILMAMYEEYQTKAQQFQQKASTWTPAIRESKEKEIMEPECTWLYPQHHGVMEREGEPEPEGMELQRMTPPSD